LPLACAGPAAALFWPGAPRASERVPRAIELGVPRVDLDLSVAPPWEHSDAVTCARQGEARRDSAHRARDRGFHRWRPHEVGNRHTLGHSWSLSPPNCTTSSTLVLRTTARRRLSWPRCC